MPFLAIFSRRFYVTVICRFRNVGAIYFSWLLLWGALILTFVLTAYVKDAFVTEVQPMLNKIPSVVFVENNKLELIPKEEQDLKKQEYIQFDKDGKPYSYISSSNKKIAFIINTSGAQIDNLPINVDFTETNELVSPTLSFIVYEDRLEVLNGYTKNLFYYSEIAQNGGKLGLEGKIINFSDDIIHFDGALNVVFFVIMFFMMIVYLAIKQAFNILVTFGFSYAIMMFLGLRISVVTMIRLNVFASTAPFVASIIGWICLDNFSLFVFLNSSVLVIYLLPLVYVTFALRDVKTNIIKAYEEQQNGGNNGNNNESSSNSNAASESLKGQILTKEDDDKFIP